MDEDRRQGNFQGMVETKLNALEEGLRAVVISVNLLGERNGTRIGEAEKQIERLKGEMEVVVVIGKWVFGPVFGSIGLTILGILGWWAFKKGQ